MSDTEQEEAQGAAASTIQVFTETRNLKSQLFTPGDDQISTGKAWDDWLKETEREFRYFKITNPLNKKDAVIIYGGKEIAHLDRSLPNPTEQLGSSSMRS